LTPADAQEWEQFVRTHPNGTPYHTLAWKRVLEQAFPLEPIYLLAWRGGTVTGILPIARQTSLLFGDRFTSLPFCTYGGPLARDAESERALLDAAAARAVKAGSKYLEVRDREIRAHDDSDLGGTWTVSSRKVGVVIDTGTSSEALRQRIEKTRRYDIRTAEKHGLEFTMVPAAEGLESFYGIFARSMRDLGTPVYPRAFFRAIASHVGDLFGFALVRHQKTPVAAALIARWRDAIEIPLMGALRSHRAMAPSAFLFWKMIERASIEGLRECDFGRSTHGSGSHAFKLKFGGTERPLPWLYFVPKGRPLPSLYREESGMQSLARAWQHCPLWLANTVGPMISRRLY
jgi:serine/alanine adding enzyme